MWLVVKTGLDSDLRQGKSSGLDETERSFKSEP
jgi:hypothetical protein